MSVMEADSARLLAALSDVLARKGLVSPAEVAERAALFDQATPAIGAGMVARAWCDAEYRALLLRDGSAAAATMGVDMRGRAPLGVMENTPELHHVIVCTLCSCYPRAVLGLPPFWYKSAAYRARAVRDPRGVLAEFGTTLPDSTRVRVLDSTADYRWMVLPLRPPGTDGWNEARLAALVHEGDMIGVTVPRTPAA